MTAFGWSSRCRYFELRNFAVDESVHGAGANAFPNRVNPFAAKSESNLCDVGLVWYP
jgi:hypothetical protein